MEAPTQVDHHMKFMNSALLIQRINISDVTQLIILFTESHSA